MRGRRYRVGVAIRVRYGGRVRVLLVSTYELGHQPLQLAVTAGALLDAGHEVRCTDLAVDTLADADVDWAEAMACSVPMHTATRLTRAVVAATHRRRPGLPVAVFGLYATAGCPGASLAVAGEHLPDLLAWVDAGAPAPGPGETAPGPGQAAPAPGASAPVRIRRGRSPVTAAPARHLLPALDRYAAVVVGGRSRRVGAVDASRGCAHRCRHCPVPVVYDGRTRLVGLDDLLADVSALVAAGAEHLTFGDPDFLNGPHHALRVVDAIHADFPNLTFDVTVKVEHVLAHRRLWPGFAEAGCLFVTTAFESVEDEVLDRLDKGHRVADELAAVEILRAAGIEPRPSLVPFTPWTTRSGVAALLDVLARADLLGNVDPVQLGIRLLLPPGSLLLGDPTVQAVLDGYDDEALTWRWHHPDPVVDELQVTVAGLAETAENEGWTPEAAHDAIRRAVADALGRPELRRAPAVDPRLRSPLPVSERPHSTEAWFCCAEPTRRQAAAVGGIR